MRGRLRGRTALIFAQVGAVVLVLVLWEVGSRREVLDPFFFGSPTGVVEVVRQWLNDGTLLHDVWVTMSVLVLGWLLGMALGALVGAVLYAWPLVHDAVSPFLAFLNATPRMVFYPFFGILLGFSMASKIGLVVFVIVVAAILNVLTGLAQVDRDILAQVRVVGGSRRTVLWNVYLPSLAGWLISSSRVTFAFALQATLISEFFGPAEGLGFRVVAGQGQFQINQVWAAVGVTVVLALVVDGALQLLRRRMTAWQAA